MQRYRAIGLMSGSSLDGLDIAYCLFNFDGHRWHFEILKSEVAEYPDEWLQEFKHLPIAGAKSLWEYHAGLGNYFGEQTKAFIERHHLQGKVDLVASHGHTIFHFPEKKFTTQIGDGAAISVHTGLPVVCDFRSADIACGGQGTPIVPIGDMKLFDNYRFCLNIGGIANISCKTDQSIVAFDICSANQVLNMLAKMMGKEYDKDGELALQGKLNTELLNRLNQLDYYHRVYPKSLDNSFSRERILPVLEESDLETKDRLRTFTEHIAFQVGAHIDMISAKENCNLSSNEKMLVTGGGAFNKYLVERIRSYSKAKVEVPDEQTVKFKEALVIAFMGVLRMRQEENVLCSVTGALRNTVGGAIYRA